MVGRNRNELIICLDFDGRWHLSLEICLNYKQKKRNEKIKLEFIPRRLPLMNSSEK